MADFTVRVSSGASVQEWTDPPYGSLPSRLNVMTSIPLKRYVGTIGTEIEMRCTVNGTESPLDAALSGRLFVPFLVEQPVGTGDVVSADAGQSSIVSFTPNKAGHYHVRIRRPQGGIWHLFFDVNDP